MEERRPKSREIDMCEGVVQNQAGMLVEHTTTTTSLYLYCKTTLLLDVHDSAHQFYHSNARFSNALADECGATTRGCASSCLCVF